MVSKWGSLFAALLMAALLVFLAVMPPSPKGLNVAADQFSSARAMKDVRIIAARPHPTGSEENAKVRAYLVKRLNELGFKTDTNISQLGERALKRYNKWSGEAKTAQDIVNVMGVLPGTDRSQPALLLMAHHDTVWGSPGAADDTIGIASILEIARSLKEDGPQKRDLIILFTDGEELGLSGAVNFFKDNPLADKVGAVINFEARGGGGTANMFQTSAQNGAAAKLYARSVKEPGTSSLSILVYNLLPNDTDLTPALKRDYVAYNIANLGLAEYYHSPKIDADALDERTLQHMGSQGLDLTRALISADALPTQKPDVTFFDAFGLFTIIYPPVLGWIFLGLAMVCYMGGTNFKTARKGALSGAVKMLGFLFAGGLLLYGLNILSGSGNGANYYDRLAAIPKLKMMVLFLCLAIAISMFGHKALSGTERFGAALPIFVLGILGQAFAPTATYFISVPLLLCGIGVLLMRRWPESKIPLFLVIVLSALVSGLMLYLGHQLMSGVGPDIPSVAILPAAILVLALLPLYNGLERRPQKFLAGSGMILSVLLALWIRFDPLASTIPLY